MPIPTSPRALLGQQARALLLPAAAAGVIDRKEAANIIRAIECPDEAETSQRQPVEAWTTQEALKFLRVKSAKTLRALARRGILHPSRIGPRSLRWNSGELRALVAISTK